MTRVKSTASRKHRKILKKAKGFRQARRIRIQVAKEALLHAGAYAYHGRKLKKRNLRSLWIVRLNAACRNLGTTYSRLTQMLKLNKIELDRKVLADIAVSDQETFKKIVETIKEKN